MEHETGWTAEQKSQAEATISGLLALLETLHKGHFHVEEDSWYSCCAHPDYGGDDDSRECCCGADAWNARIDAMIAQTQARLDAGFQ
jgi:hypothetical protein